MTDPTPTPTTPAVTVRSAREVIKAHVEALELWARRLSPGHPDDVFSRLLHHPSWSDEVHRVASTAGPLRALLDAPTGSAVERLCEVVGAGAKKCSCAFSEKDDDARCNPAACKCAGCHADEWRGALARVTEERNEAMRQRNAFADRLSAIAKGYGGPFATPEERVEYCERGRETLTNDLKTLRAERDSLKADLAAARAELDRIPAATLPPLSDRVKWVAQYIKEHVSLDEDSARVLAKEGAEILRIAEEAVMAKEAPRG